MTSSFQSKKINKQTRYDDNANNRYAIADKSRLLQLLRDKQKPMWKPPRFASLILTRNKIKKNTQTL